MSNEDRGVVSKLRALDNVQAVLLDADDTLWENNMFFLQCIEWLCITGRRLGFTDKAVTTMLDRHEHNHIALMGFGYHSFERSLVETVRELCLTSRYHAPHHAGLRLRAQQWVRFLRRHPIILMPGVEETIPHLARTYRTIIVTKGDQTDQMSKVYRSGLLPLLEGAEVVSRKSVADYRRVLEKYDLRPEETVMVGNSPSSDVNRAKEAGMRTIFVPHKQTWHFEVETIIPTGPETLHVPHFGALRDVLRLAM